MKTSLLTENQRPIKGQFNTYAHRYDKHAIIQKKMAYHLLGQVNTKPTSILDIGCGTGLLTRLLANKFPDAKITAVDSSARMIALARQKLSNTNTQFILQDVEKLDLINKYDLITGNAVIQWFSHPEITIKKLAGKLNSSGTFLTATFGPETFCELKGIFKRVEDSLGLENAQHHLNLPSVQHLRDIFTLASLGKINIFEKIERIHYLSCKDFLHSVKYMGASYSNNSYSIGTMRKVLLKVMKEYDQSFRSDMGVYATYHIIYILSSN